MNLDKFLEHVQILQDGEVEIFEPTAWQRELLEHISNGKKLNFFPRMREKGITSNEFTCAHLMQMSQGQRFALVTPGKTFVFELTEIAE